MPRRAAPGHRAKLEEALSPSLRAALEEMRVLFDVVDWRQTPLGPPFQAAAAILEAARLRRGGMSATKALHVAACRLGVEADTVRSWATRWSADSRGHFARTGGGSSGVRLIEDAAEEPGTGDAAA